MSLFFSDFFMKLGDHKHSSDRAGFFGKILIFPKRAKSVKIALKMTFLIIPKIVPLVFLIFFCTKLGYHKHSKVTECYFSRYNNIRGSIGSLVLVFKDNISLKYFSHNEMIVLMYYLLFFKLCFVLISFNKLLNKLF